MNGMMQHTLSPTHIAGSTKVERLIDPGTGNPFIQKSDIVKHQGKIMKISNRMNNIQTGYQD